MLEDTSKVTGLNKYVRKLARAFLTLVGVMHQAMCRGIHPLQGQAHPMHQYGGQDDITQVIQVNFFEGRSIQEMLSLMFKNKIVDFPTKPDYYGFLASSRG